MATTHNLSKIIDANGDEYLIKAKGLENQINISLSGDVSGSTTSDLSGNVTITGTTIGNGAVTTSKIADVNVTTGKIADGAVTLTKIAASATEGAIASGVQTLATHDQVFNAINAAISGQGTYLGKQTVATINTHTASNLHNGDRVIASDSGTVTLGNLAVRAGEDLIFWKNGSTAIWQSMDGEFKLKQTAKSDPAASGTTLTAIATITQDANGEITATKKTIQDGTTSQKGVVQLQDSVDTSTTTKAVTPKAVGNAIASEASARATAITNAINALDATKTSTDGTNVQVKVTETDGKITGVNVVTDNTASRAALEVEVEAREDAVNDLDSRISAIEGSNVTGVKGDAETTYRTGQVNITKANIGLGNVDNKSEATIKSDFTGSIASGNTGFPTGGAVYTALAGKEASFTINYKSADNALVFHKTFGTET